MPTDDYIKRDDVKTAVFAWCVDAMRHGEKKYLDEVIAKIPAAEVEPVMRGHWIPINRTNPSWSQFGVAQHKCSECGSEEVIARKRCPECGAKMMEK